MSTQQASSLELSRVLLYLAGFAVSESGQQACLSLTRRLAFEQYNYEKMLFEQGQLWLEQTGFSLTTFPALEQILQSAENSSAILDQEALWSVRTVLLHAKDVIEQIQPHEDRCNWPLWQQRSTLPFAPVKTVSALSRCLADDGYIRDEASPGLSGVREELRKIHQQCTRKVRDFAVEYNILHFLQDEFMTLSSDRYVLPLKKNFKGRLQGIIHEYSQTGETCYFEPIFLVDVNNKLQELKREEREEERKVLIYLTNLVREELAGIRSAFSLLVDIDVLQAKNAFSSCFDGRMLTFEDGQGVYLRDARHPLLALAASPAACKALAHVQKDSMADDEGMSALTLYSVVNAHHVVASTIELLPEQQGMVISGGNAGGKTVSLKTLGLIAQMSLSGLPVPVLQGSFLPKWTDVHAFIGDEQSLDDHVSTFTAQITHLARIWPSLTSQSLVILDEFGAGTDPSQGAALAQAVMDSIIESGAYVIAATHFPALKAYALSAPKVRAASVLFDPKTKKPLFQLVYDQVGASQALEVAKEHGLPETILRKAEQYLLLSGDDTASLIERLNALAVKREAEIKALQLEKEDFEQKRKKLTEKFTREKEELFKKVQADAQKVLSSWKAGRISHKQTLKELAQVRNELLEQKKAEATLSLSDTGGLQIGQQLRYIPWNRAGVLLEIDQKKNRIRLDFGGVTLWAELADVADAGAGKKASSILSGVSAGAVGKSSLPSVPVLPLRLDIRGLRADVAVNEVSKFLDSAILQGREKIEIIHGRGTGVLRREVHDFLKKYTHAAAFYLANEEQGGDGMTVVELK